MAAGLRYLVLSLWSLVSITSAVQYERGIMVPLDASEGSPSPFAFSASWEVLGPFQIGTREATWGADPLEYVGGFRALDFDEKARFRSSISTNGTARWTVVDAKQTSASPSSANVSLSVGYPDVDWDFLKVVYGWAAVQYQAWTRGEIAVTGQATQHAILYTDMILEYWIDGIHYFGGDFFGFRKAPVVLHLEPGRHTIDIRLVRDVRAMGGVLDPTIDVVLELRQATGSLELAREGMLIADVVDGKLASPFGSIYVRNSGAEDLEIVNVTSSIAQIALLGNGQPLIVAAGQTRPLALQISLQGHNSTFVAAKVNYKPIDPKGRETTLAVSQNLIQRSQYDPHKVTHLHRGSIVSYSMLKPPPSNATCTSMKNTSLPVLLQLHGAGLEADSDMVAHALDPAGSLCAWVIFPTGVTPWSADDWHNWGFADVEHAVENIPSWVKAVGWKGPGVDINRWVVSGHSNGGQGTWYAITHRPDKLIAAAPVSGYSSIQKYVPYELWQPMDPRRTAVISASLNSYRHEMLMANARGIPILQQHGEKDDNVPAYNSRLLSQKLFQEGTLSDYHEIPGQGHWFDGVMTTPPLQDFYHEQTVSNKTPSLDLQNFDIVIADPGDMGSKGGINVLQLEDPGQYGRVHVAYNDTLKAYMLQTTNVLSMQIPSRFFQVVSLTVDGYALSLAADFQTSGQSTELLKDPERQKWKVGSLHAGADSILIRRGRILGSMTAILRSKGPFTISHQGNATARLALQISRNLHQYFYADSAIEVLGTGNPKHRGNVITVAVGDSVAGSAHPDFPIQIAGHKISIRDHRGRVKIVDAKDGGLSAAFLRPLEDEGLELVLWGSDVGSLSQAVRLVPMLTGVGQPDFVVLTDAVRWKGVEGAAALGFFDHAWRVTASSLT